jgi:hypothetical protein
MSTISTRIQSTVSAHGRDMAGAAGRSTGLVRALACGVVLGIWATSAGAQELFVGSSNTVILKGDALAGDFQVVGACGGVVSSMALQGESLLIGAQSGNVYHYDDSLGAIGFAYAVSNDANAMVRQGAEAFIGGSDGSILRVDALTGNLLGTLSNMFTVDAIGVDDTTLLIASANSFIQQGNTSTGDFEFIGACGGSVQSMVRRDDDVFFGTTSGLVYHYDLATQSFTYSFFVASDCKAMVLDGAHILVGGTNGTILRVNSVTGAAIGSLAVGMPIEAMAIENVGEGPGSAYCFGIGCPCGNDDPAAGCMNSTGRGARIVGSGTASSSADDLVMVVQDLPSNSLARFYMGGTQVNQPLGDGLNCTGSNGYGLFRFPALATGAEAVISQGPGTVQHAANTFGVGGQLLPGTTWNFQVWYRNPAGPCGAFFSTSNAYSVTFTP